MGKFFSQGFQLRKAPHLPELTSLLLIRWRIISHINRNMLPTATYYISLLLWTPYMKTYKIWTSSTMFSFGYLTSKTTLKSWSVFIEGQKSWERVWKTCPMKDRWGIWGLVWRTSEEQHWSLQLPQRRLKWGGVKLSCHIWSEKTSGNGLKVH